MFPKALQRYMPLLGLDVGECWGMLGNAGGGVVGSGECNLDTLWGK